MATARRVYALAVSLPKFEIVGTSAWFFFIINALKIPFSIGLGLIHTQTLLLNLVLSPAIVAGVFGGRWIVDHVPQRVFDAFLLAFATASRLSCRRFGTGSSLMAPSGARRSEAVGSALRFGPWKTSPSAGGLTMRRRLGLAGRR